MTKKILYLLSNPKIFLYTMFWLMILVIVGTLAQANIGLYESQQKYFSSWIAWFNFIPVPGGRLTLLVMFVNFLFFMFDPLFWSFKKIGVITTHLGVLLLLMGGGVTAWFSSEGMMVIEEESSSNYVFNLYKKELAIIDMSNNNYDDVVVINDELLAKEGIIENSKIPFTIEVIDYFTNCEIKERIDSSLEYKGFAKRFELSELKDEQEIEINRPGITFRISNSNKETDGIYSLFLQQNVPQTININDKVLNLSLRRERTYLSFDLELIDFKKDMHPGTEIAKSFSSSINLYEDGIKRPVLIKMNHPLRHQNYTFYQSSYREGFDKDTTILSVVKNYGRLFPYISSIIMSFGLLLHIILKVPRLFKERTKRAAL